VCPLCCVCCVLESGLQCRLPLPHLALWVGREKIRKNTTEPNAGATKRGGRVRDGRGRGAKLWARVARPGTRREQRVFKNTVLYV